MKKNKIDKIFEIENVFLRWLCVLWILLIAILTIIILSPLWILIQAAKRVDEIWDSWIERRH